MRVLQCCVRVRVRCLNVCCSVAAWVFFHFKKGLRKHPGRSPLPLIFEHRPLTDMFPWENETTTQQPRALAASPSGPENAGNVPCSPQVSIADILGGNVKNVAANECASLLAQQASRRAQLEAQQAQRLETEVQEDLRVVKEAEVLQACYQHTPRGAPDLHQVVAGGRMPTRTEHTGISDHSSTRVHAAPGGHSSLSLSDVSVPEASRPAPQQQQQQQAAAAPLYVAAEQHATEQHAAASAIRERARGGTSLW